MLEKIEHTMVHVGVVLLIRCRVVGVVVVVIYHDNDIMFSTGRRIVFAQVGGRLAAYYDNGGLLRGGKPLDICVTASIAIKMIVTPVRRSTILPFLSIRLQG